MLPVSGSIATSKGSDLLDPNGPGDDPDGVGIGEQERSILRDRVMAGLERVRQEGKRLGRTKVAPKVEDAIRRI